MIGCEFNIDAAIKSWFFPAPRLKLYYRTIVEGRDFKGFLPDKSTYLLNPHSSRKAEPFYPVLSSNILFDELVYFSGADCFDVKSTLAQ